MSEVTFLFFILLFIFIYNKLFVAANIHTRFTCTVFFLNLDLYFSNLITCRHNYVMFWYDIKSPYINIRTPVLRQLQNKCWITTYWITHPCEGSHSLFTHPHSNKHMSNLLQRPYTCKVHVENIGQRLPTVHVSINDKAFQRSFR